MGLSLMPAPYPPAGRANSEKASGRRYTAVRMLRSWRLRRAHLRFLSASRSQASAQSYWEVQGGLGGCLSLFLPPSFFAVDEDGRRLLAALDRLEAGCRERRADGDELLACHRLLFEGRRPDAGRLRSVPIEMGAENPLRPPPPSRLPALFEGLDAWARAAQDRLDQAGAPAADDVLGAAVDLHVRIGALHPFGDGNGRVARLAMNHLLRRYGQPYVIYPALSTSPAFWDALLAAGRGEREPLLAFAKGCRRRV